MPDLLKDSWSFVLLAEAINPLQVASRAAHILAAMVLVGGLCYLRFVLVPASTLGAGGNDEAMVAQRRRWAKWVGICTLFLLVSGVYNTFLRFSGVKLPGLYHGLLAAKFLLAFVVFFLASILAGKTEAADRFRRNQVRWLNISVLSAVAIVCLAAVLRYIPGEPKTKAGPVEPAVSSQPAPPENPSE